MHLFPVCIASLLFSYSATSRKCVIKLSVSVSVTGAMWASNILLHHLKNLRVKDEFDHLYSHAETAAAGRGLRVSLASEVASEWVV